MYIESPTVDLQQQKISVIVVDVIPSPSSLFVFQQQKRGGSNVRLLVVHVYQTCSHTEFNVLNPIQIPKPQDLSDTTKHPNPGMI